MPAEVPSSDAAPSSVAALRRVDALNTRRSLISRLRNVEDRDSWQDFFDTYWKLIFSVARKAGCTEQEAEEVVQETTVAVSKYIKDYQYDPKVCSFKNWLMHKTQWRIIDQVRKRPPDFLKRVAPPAETSGTSLLDRIPDRKAWNWIRSGRRNGRKTSWMQRWNGSRGASNRNITRYFI
jgi:RNA polymerase sigma factor (sigma-70 family)